MKSDFNLGYYRCNTGVGGCMRLHNEDHQIKENETGGACRTHGKDEK
jgi:hypothetical protein